VTRLTKGKTKQCLFPSYVTSCACDDAVRVLIYPYIYQRDRDGRDSSVGTATRLRAGRSGVRTPVGTKFSLSVQYGPEAHPASCTRGTGSLLRGLCSRGVALTTHLRLAPRLKEYSYTSTPHLGLHDVTGRSLPLTLSYM